MEPKGKVFVSGPYSGTLEETALHVARARVVISNVLQAGWAPVCPNVFWSPFADLQDYDFWLEAALSLLETCDALILVPGWKNSSGAQKEVARAKELGIPVFETVDQLEYYGNHTEGRKPLGLKELRELEKVMVTFTDEHRISGPESVSQDDDVIINAYGLIEKLTGIVGYYEYPED